MGIVKRKVLLITIVVLPILLMIGHAPDEIYRSEYSLCVADTSNNCGKHNVQLHNKGKDDEYLLGFIRNQRSGPNA